MCILAYLIAVYCGAQPRIKENVQVNPTLFQNVPLPVDQVVSDKLSDEDWHLSRLVYWMVFFRINFCCMNARKSMQT